MHKSSLPRAQGPVSISDETSYCKISQSIEAARLKFIIVPSLWIFDRRLTNAATEMADKFQSDAIIYITNLAPGDFTRYLTIKHLSDIETGSSTMWKYCDISIRLQIFFCNSSIDLLWWCHGLWLYTLWIKTEHSEIQYLRYLRLTPLIGHVGD